MIDPHVHCRDWAENHKETIAHALHVAEMAGIAAIFDMPNTNPPLVSANVVKRRLEDAKRNHNKVFYGVYIGLSKVPKQIQEAVQVYNTYFPQVVGFKMYAGHSVGSLAIPGEEDQRRVYETLSDSGYQGVLAVHCEKEELMKPELWNPHEPVSHTLVRPPEAETRSIRDQILFAADSSFAGTLHIAHISHPDSVAVVRDERERQSFKISCGVTPHHCLLNSDMMSGKEGLLLKVNPPLRKAHEADVMLEYLRDGVIDFVETDHAPHTLQEKLNPPYMSGFPGLPFVPHFLRYLRLKGFSEKEIHRSTHERVCEVFQFDVKNDVHQSDYNLEGEYEVDVYTAMRKEIQTMLTL